MVFLLRFSSASFPIRIALKQLSHPRKHHPRSPRRRRRSSLSTTALAAAVGGSETSSDRTLLKLGSSAARKSFSGNESSESLSCSSDPSQSRTSSSRSRSSPPHSSGNGPGVSEKPLPFRDLMERPLLFPRTGEEEQMSVYHHDTRASGLTKLNGGAAT